MAMILEVGGKYGWFAVVDDDVYAWASKSKWYVKKCRRGGYYVVRHEGRSSGSRKCLYLHVLIMGGKSDHIDHNTMNCLKSNLRRCTTRQNNFNKRIRSDNRSGYKGIEKLGGKWRARITCDGLLVPLGYFADKVEAARAYDRAALIFHGEFACLNFPDERYASHSRP